MRKPIALLAAGSMMLMPLLGATSVVLTPVSEAYAETADSIYLSDMGISFSIAHSQFHFVHVFYRFFK